MTAAKFRHLALALPATEERSHMNHPDFRVGGKIFATLGYPSAGWAMVKLKPADQAHFYEMDPKAFIPAKGAWGRQGATNVVLKSAKESDVFCAIALAWRNVAPKHLAKEYETTRDRK
ncbi:MAG TPA: MmcQ/YjbR family DNA-binding protein [Candidatus Limnocylindrales bacterium]|nr:MmcQ/YjbR family DNA-binding protein [Candidatus Limnocylindrales bacterium]